MQLFSFSSAYNSHLNDKGEKQRFGDKFYKRLGDLEPWQQTVFALALAERMYPNYQLYAEVRVKAMLSTFRAALDSLWRYPD